MDNVLAVPVKEFNNLKQDPDLQMNDCLMEILMNM